MVAKVGIVERLGERAVLLPALIEEGLAANDRLKIRLTMMQEAAAQVSEPGRQAPSMERERRSVGLKEPMFNATISGARRIDAETFLAPGAEALSAGIASDLKAMMGPIEVAEPEIAASLRRASTRRSEHCPISRATASPIVRSQRSPRHGAEATTACISSSWTCTRR